MHFGSCGVFNPHFHATVLEGGFDDEGTFFYIPFSGLDAMVEVFRRRVIWLLVEKELLAEEFAIKLLGWKHSGFSIDKSVRILDREAQTNLAEYISRPPISLKKIRYEPFKGRVLFHTTYSEYFKQNVHMQVACPGRSRRLRPGFHALDFLAELTQHIPPKGTQRIRRYGLYSSRIKGRLEEMDYVAERAAQGWRTEHERSADSDQTALGFTPPIDLCPRCHLRP